MDGDKLKFTLAAIEIVGTRTDDLKRVVVYQALEGEKPTGNLKLSGEHHFGIEYYPPIAKRTQGGRDLFARYFDQLHRFFSNKCTEPDEMVQTTFMAVLRARDKFEGRSSFRTYIFTIARHELYRHVRNLQRDKLFDPAISSIAQIATTVGAKLARNQEHRALMSTSSQ